MTIPYYDGIAHHAMRQPQSLAAVDLATGRRHTYQAFDDRIARLAGTLRSRFGIGRGDRIAVLAPNATDTFEVQFACGRIGAIFVPLNWRLANTELKAILADCEAALLIHDPEFGEQAEALNVAQRCSLGSSSSQCDCVALSVTERIVGVGRKCHIATLSSSEDPATPAAALRPSVNDASGEA